MSELMVPQHRKQQRRSRAVKKDTLENGKTGKAKKPKPAGKAAKVEEKSKDEDLPNGNGNGRSVVA